MTFVIKHLKTKNHSQQSSSETPNEKQNADANSLSDKIWDKDYIDSHILVSDIKEAVKKLEEDIKDNSSGGLITEEFVLQWINKIFGKELSK